MDTSNCSKWLMWIVFAVAVILLCNMLNKKGLSGRPPPRKRVQLQEIELSSFNFILIPLFKYLIINLDNI